MSFINKTIKAEVSFDGSVVIADVNLDWVRNEVYINSVIYKETDIKSIISEASEESLIENLTTYCIQRGL